MNKKRFSLDINKIFSEGTQLYKKYFNEVITVYLGIFILSSFNNYIILTYYSKAAYTLFNLLLSIITLCMTLGLYIYFHCKEEKEPIALSDAFKNVTPRIIPVFITEIVYMILVGLGFLLLIIPGIVLFIMFSQAVFFSLLEAKSPQDALKASRKLTCGVRWNLFLFYLIVGVVTVLINIAAGNIFPTIVVQLIDKVVDSFMLVVTFTLWRTLRNRSAV